MKEVILNDCCENIFSGGTPNTKKPEYWGGEFFWLSSGETRNHFITKTKKTITEEGVKNSSTRLSIPNDILIASAGQGKTRGQTSFNTIKTYINQSIIALRPNPKIVYPLYLYYLISSKYDSLRRMSDGNAIRGSLTCKVFKKLKITIPDSLEKQQKIAKILSNYDNLIENNIKRIELLEKTAKLIYEEWFVKFRFPGHKDVKMVECELGEIPEEWEVKEIDSFCEFVSRGVTPKYEEGSKKYIINQKVNKGSQLELQYLKELSSELKVPEEKMLLDGDVLINSLGEGTIGRVHLYNSGDNKYAFDQHISVCRSLDKKKSLVLFYYLSSDSGQKWIDSVKTGGTNMTMLNISILRKCKAIIPKDSLLKEFYNEIINLLNLKSKLENKNIVLQKTRDLLLPKLINGQVDVSDLDIAIPEVKA